MNDEHAKGEVPAEDGRYLPVRREVVAPPRRRAAVVGRRRAFTAVVLVWVVVVITVPAIALRSPSGGNGADRSGVSTEAGAPARNGPLTESPPRKPDPTTTIPDPATYARLGLPIPQFNLPPPRVAAIQRTPGVDGPWETPPPTEAPTVTSSTVQVLNQVVGVEVNRTDDETVTSTTSTTSESAEVAGASETPPSPHSGTLARTGLEPWVLALAGIGAALLVLGVVLVWLARRRRLAKP